MILFKLDTTSKKLTRLQSTTLANEKLTEPADLESWIIKSKEEIFSRNILWIARQDFINSDQRSDLIGISKSGALVICELKRGIVNDMAITQALGYAAEYQHYDIDDISSLLLNHITKGNLEISEVKSQEDARNYINHHLTGGTIKQEIKINEEQIIILTGEDFSPSALAISDYLNFGSETALIECWNYKLFKDLENQFNLSVEQILPPPSVRIAIEQKREESRGRKYARDPVRTNFMNSFITANIETTEFSVFRNSGASYYCYIKSNQKSDLKISLDMYEDIPKLNIEENDEISKKLSDKGITFKVSNNYINISLTDFNITNTTYSDKFKEKIIEILKAIE